MRISLKILFVTIIAFSCNKNENLRKSEGNFNSNESGWLIDKDEVIGEVNDLFPLVSSPKFKKVESTRYIPEYEKVYAIRHNNTIKVFPHVFIHNIEVVNDNIDDLYYAISLCPKTNTTIAWNRIIGNDTAEFRASGMLYKDNLLPIDVHTGDIWSQMLNQCVSGKYSGYMADNVGIIELSWGIIKKYYPNSLVFDLAGSLENSSNSMLKNDIYDIDDAEDDAEDVNPQLPLGMRVFGFPGFNRAVLYPTENYNNQVSMISTNSMLIVILKEMDYTQAFYVDAGSEYEIVSGEFPIILTDSKANEVDMFGYIVNGPDKGNFLKPVDSYRAYYWAWRDMFYKISVVEN